MQTVEAARPLPTHAVVLGATGMVGRSWCELLQERNVPFTGLSRPKIDLLRPERLLDSIPPDADLIINAAAWTDVDGAESDEAGAMIANAEAPARLAEHAQTSNATLIHYSTDYVFDGLGSSPYPPSAKVDPVNAYGRSKAAGESAVRAIAPENHLIVRTSWVYAPWGKNFVRTIAAAADARDSLTVVNDQRGRPTSAQALASSSLDLYLAGAQGTWHATDAGACTWFDLAAEIVAQLRLSTLVEPCGSERFPRPAPRPSYSVLDLDATEQLIGPRQAWQESLRAVLNSPEYAP